MQSTTRAGLGTGGVLPETEFLAPMLYCREEGNGGQGEGQATPQSLLSAAWLCGLDQVN